MQSTVINPAEQVTPRQLELLEMVERFRSSRRYSPTVGELAAGLGISRSTAFEHISALRKKGLLSNWPGKARSLMLTCQAQELLKGLSRNTSDSHADGTGDIPLLGRVAAGSPIEAIENKQMLSMRCCFGDDDGIFALEVRGDSMVDIGIHDGDYVICRQSCVADNGRLVIAIVNEEQATLKRFYKEKNRVKLQPANADYQPIYSDNCRIEAVVVGLVRKFNAG